MTIVKLTSKVQKNMFEHAKNKKKSGGGDMSLDSLAALAPLALEEPPLTFSSSYGLETTSNVLLTLAATHMYAMRTYFLNTATGSTRP